MIKSTNRSRKSRYKTPIKAVISRFTNSDLFCLRAEGGARVAWDGTLLTFKKHSDYEKRVARFLDEVDAKQFATAHGFVCTN